MNEEEVEAIEAPPISEEHPDAQVEEVLDFEEESEIPEDLNAELDLSDVEDVPDEPILDELDEEGEEE